MYHSWEYKFLKEQEDFNLLKDQFMQLGIDGWQFCGKYYNYLIFKRRLIQ